MLLRLLETLARRRRAGSANAVWPAVTFAIFLLRTYQKRAGHDAIVLREELKPGETLVISHTHQHRG